MRPLEDKAAVARMKSSTATSEPVRYFNWRRFTAVAGPGLVVMLADTDAGSVITAAQSGAQWGYRLLLLQLILVPILYIVQELTVRLGIVSGKGHAELIRDHYGRGWAWLSVSTLVLACIGASFSWELSPSHQSLYACVTGTQGIAQAPEPAATTFPSPSAAVFGNFGLRSGT